MHRFAPFLWLLALSAFFLGRAEAESRLMVDGRLDEDVWSSSVIINDFVITQPLTREKPDLQTTVRYASTQEGLAIAFISEQPRATAESRAERRRRDAAPMATDFVYAIIDFDGSGIRGYEFMVSRSGAQRDGSWVNEIQANLDWDGELSSAVRDNGDEWTAEILIPWSVVPMRRVDRDGTRTIGLNFGRWIEARGERHSWPSISFSEQRFLSMLERVSLPGFSASAFGVVPYTTSGHDLLDGTTRNKVGLDLYWRYDARLQFAGAWNPDFGQVEADDLIINFDAVEAFFSDRRPLFTENQSLFSLGSPQGGQLFYTRRIGGPSDFGDGSAADIRAAYRVNGSWGWFDYGAFAADEDGASGRSFRVARAQFAPSKFQIGKMWMNVDRPWINRQSTVGAIDARASIFERASIDGALVRSETDTPTGSSNGDGAWARVRWNPDSRTEANASFALLDRSLQLNDLGFLPRNNLRQADFLVRKRWPIDNVDVDESIVSWQLRGSLQKNLDGLRLQNEFVASRLSDIRGGGIRYFEFGYTPPGFDDLITRGNGPIRRPRQFWALLNRQSARVNGWRYRWSASAFPEGLSRYAAMLLGRAEYQFHDDLSSYAQLEVTSSPDWLIWRPSTRLATYEREQVRIDVGLEWLPSDSGTLQVRAQWFAVDARDGQGLQVIGHGLPVPNGRDAGAFTVASFGLQVRYIHRISARRELYAVYARGGGLNDLSVSRGPASALVDAFNSLTTDQLVLKFVWKI